MNYLAASGGESKPIEIQLRSFKSSQPTNPMVFLLFAYLFSKILYVILITTQFSR
ncbi:MAG: hypothetical protein M1470_05415 [Bacteroidetes bacterium]|nr:hypothetical protein [Bacteroidota bacterium]MCL5737289.1 hypothetical protein [Bacteroidota bacterium]